MFKRISVAVASLTLFAATAMPASSQGTLRIGMTAADSPLTTGQPDQGFEGFRFAGYTIYDALGIDPRKQIHTPDGRPLEILAEGATVRELYGLVLYRRGWKAMREGKSGDAAADFERATRDPSVLKGSEPLAL